MLHFVPKNLQCCVCSCLHHVHVPRFEDQLPCRTGPQTHHSRCNVQQNKDCLIQISKFKFSIVVSGLTNILKRINELRPTHAEFERDYYESLIIVLDTLEKCLSTQAQDSQALVKWEQDPGQGLTSCLARATLDSLSPFLSSDSPQGYTDTGREQLRTLASKVLFALSLNNFGAVFSRISGRLQVLSKELAVDSGVEQSDHTDIELIQHINVDIGRLTKLLAEAIAKFRQLKKNAHLVLMVSLEKAVWNWMDTYPHVSSI